MSKAEKTETTDKDTPKDDAADSAESAGNGNPEAKKPADQPQAQQSVTINDEDVVASYANFCRVSSTPEELILDLGLNPNPFGPNATIKVSARIILNHYTAKRLLSALGMALQRHEQAFGVLETDIRKRVKTPLPTQ